MSEGAHAVSEGAHAVSEGAHAVSEGAHAAVARLPAAPGVYRFRDARGRVLYVGRAGDLRRRVSSYWGPLRDRRHLVRMVPRVERIEATACDSEHEAAWFERNLLERSLPRWNRSRGEDVPVYIRLDSRPRSPGLSVVHLPRPMTGVTHFGPYLGGAKARLAVSALHRVLPLAYTGDGRSGCERDLARVRGVAVADRERLVNAVARVLDRDPTAVASLRDELTGQRDAAAQALAFELAAVLQAEREAMDWIVAAQRATVAEPADFDIHGWADGLLVRFEVRGGRLCGWTQRACSQRAAQPHLAATPADWTGFAQRNADLAVLLAG